MATLPTQPVQSTEPGANPAANSDPRPLDILFLQDATGSQGPYISSARSAIKDICEKISANTSLSKGSIRFGLIAFRDHPPQDTSFVTKNFGFTSDVAKMTQNLANLIASGGGDGPEAQTAALAEALNMEWAENAVKIVVLITDAPPHGLGEVGDGFAKSPDQNDPLDIVRQMAERGITLYVIACEPSLSRYIHAVDFYRAICQICSGRMVPLLNASQLGDYIVGSAVETIETEKLIGEFQSVILEDVYGQGKPIEEVMNNVQAQLTERNVQIQTLNVEDVYAPSVEADHNTNVSASAATLGSARGKTKSARDSRVAPTGSLLGAPPGAPPSGPVAFGAPMSTGAAVPPAGGRVGGLFGFGGGPRARGRASVPAPAAAAAAPPPPSVQAVSMASQAVDQGQTNRIVMQSLMRG
ncbi:hypothetical protein EST38_g5858 [Candolleomyces aberdarensis]|uniref:VWFA domain-containing protein n=1 Tax=Candolleomyces aberdarensis TaxID=2316362 RepID=A0A4Q2DJD6_9AGAR|nr:hypothetical protein EST38_g5858 [Candolleomyces aberdarensis]